MAIASTDIIYRLSGGSSNATPASSLGGAKSSTAVTGSTILDAVSAAESTAGDTNYRCIYVHNNHGSLSLDNAVLWISANTPSADTDITVGAGSSAINGTEQTVANEATAPTSVTFSSPSSRATGIALGNIPAGQHKAVWIKRVVNAGAAAVSDSFTLRVEGDTAP